MCLQVALILGIIGACRRNELYELTTADINFADSMIIVTIPDSKTHIKRTFTIEGKYSEIVKKYINLRPAKSTSDHFFLCFRNGKCINQVIGKNKMGSMPKEIASFLQLPDAKLYTGHSFRRTSATLLADAGADITTIKRLGGWKSTNVAEGYIEDSVNNKRKMSNRIADSIGTPPNKKSKSNDKSSVPQNSFNFTFQFNNLNNPSTSTCEPRE